MDLGWFENNESTARLWYKISKKVRNIDSIFHRKYQKAGGQILQQTRGVRRMRRMVLWHGKPDDLCYKNEFSTLLSYYCRFLSWWQPMKPWILQLFPKIHSTPQLLHLPVLDSPTKFWPPDHNRHHSGRTSTWVAWRAPGSIQSRTTGRTFKVVP